VAETNLKLSKNWTYVEDPSPLGYHAMQSGRDMETFQRKMPSFSSTLKMEASGAS